ncbi:MAG: sigma 54-interacting transcriptional regulator [Planctomycetota bacterium]
MQLFTTKQRSQAEAISQLAFSNPFLPERIEHERTLLGPAHQSGDPVWNVEYTGRERRNVTRITEITRAVSEAARAKLAAGHRPSDADAALYADLVLYRLFDQTREKLNATIEAAHRGEKNLKPRYWPQFAEEARRFFAPAGEPLPVAYDTAHMFACFFQIRRAFHHVFNYVVGSSTAAAELRAAVWRSVFSNDLRRYHRSLYLHMHDVTTLITGPSGTGKELVARAIAFSRYVPFDANAGRFEHHFPDAFQAVNLSALSPTLLESELFGHCKGSFTGAVGERVGWLEACGPGGTVFLDEIGETEHAVQVKLLRVLQARTFQRLGETADRRFEGKIVAATNRVLQEEINAGRFRQDFYYRICSDRIETPSLRRQLDDAPEDLRRLLLFIAGRVAPEEAEPLADEVCGWIETNLPAEYPWPGNVRELEQCCRSVMIHGAYCPACPEEETVKVSSDPWSASAEAARGGSLTADQLLGRYCRHVYDQYGSYEETARRLGLDRRTVKRKIVEHTSDA